MVRYRVRKVRKVGLKEAHHAVELDAAGLLGRLHVHELAHHLVVLPLGAGEQQLGLGGDGIALPFLLLGGNPGVENGFPGKKRVRLQSLPHAASVRLIPPRLPSLVGGVFGAAQGGAARPSNSQPHPDSGGGPNT